MSLILAPVAARDPTAPAVGIFWRVGDHLVIDRTPLAAAEPYGECLTHAAGHHERWEEWRTLGGAGLRAAGLPTAIAASEYDDWPRGRVVYEVSARRFVIYADQRLQRHKIVERLEITFGLSHVETIVRSDLHYR